MPPPMAVDSRRIYVRPRTVRSPHMAKLQAASVPIAYGSCAMGQRDGHTDGRIAVSLNAPYGGRHNNPFHHYTVYRTNGALVISCNITTALTPSGFQRGCKTWTTQYIRSDLVLWLRILSCVVTRD